MHSKALIPLYDRYKDRGFTVVGVARGFKDTMALDRAIEQDRYQWVNVYDLDDKLALWDMYGHANGTGKIILVDETGKVIYIDRSAEQIEEYLSSRLY